MKNKILLTAIILTSSLSSASWRETGGGETTKIDHAKLTMVLQGGGLKKAMLNYLESFSVEKIDDSTEEGRAVKAAFQRVMKADGLQRDIATANNYVIAESCRDSAGASVSASAVIGDIGGPICFDVVRLVKEYQGLDDEQLMIKLASLVFHEHIHHFQSSSVRLSENEKEAYLVAAYVGLTARFAKVPLLVWAPPATQKKYGIYLKDLPAGSTIKVGPNWLLSAGAKELDWGVARLNFAGRLNRNMDFSNAVFTTSGVASFVSDGCASNSSVAVDDGGGECEYVLPIKNGTVKRMEVKDFTNVECDPANGSKYILKVNSGQLTVDELNACVGGAFEIIPNTQFDRP